MGNYVNPFANSGMMVGMIGGSTVTSGGLQTGPGTILPYNPPPPIRYKYANTVHLSDSDIELMALCIANAHPLVEGQAGCFCALKRLEKGISKE